MNYNNLYNTNQLKSVIGFLNDYTVIDLETTGLDPYKDEIIEMAAVKVRSGQVVNTCSYLVKPSRPISRKIESITGITNNNLRRSPNIRMVFQKYLDFIGNDIVVGHNVVAFDREFIQKACYCLRCRPFTNDALDTLIYARRYRLDVFDYRLATLSEHFNIKHNAHRALGDCLATHGCYEILKNMFNVVLERKNVKFGKLIEGYYITHFFRGASIMCEREVPAEVFIGDSVDLFPNGDFDIEHESREIAVVAQPVNRRLGYLCHGKIEQMINDYYKCRDKVLGIVSEISNGRENARIDLIFMKKINSNSIEITEKESYTSKEADIYSFQYANLINDCIHNLNVTIDPLSFCSRYNVMLSCAKELLKMESVIKFNGEKPSHFFDRIEEQKYELTNDFVDRYYKAAVEKINSLKTTQAKKNNADKLSTTLIELRNKFPNELSDKIDSIMLSIKNI